MLVSLCEHCFYRIGKNLTVKVADFGLTGDIHATNHWKLHHHKWMSPESLMDSISDQMTDVVSCLCGKLVLPR